MNDRAGTLLIAIITTAIPGIIGWPVRLDRYLSEEAFDFAPQIGGRLLHRF
jgi:hypothetical protein